jgi:hypothetical protein
LGTNEVVVKKNDARHTIVATSNKLINVLIQEAELVIVLVITCTPPEVNPTIGLKNMSPTQRIVVSKPSVGPPHVEDPTSH